MSHNQHVNRNGRGGGGGSRQRTKVFYNSTEKAAWEEARYQKELEDTMMQPRFRRKKLLESTEPGTNNGTSGPRAPYRRKQDGHGDDKESINTTDPSASSIWDAAEKELNSSNIRRLDPEFKAIVKNASQVAAYQFKGVWEYKTEAVGSLFLYERKGNPSHGIYIINRIGIDHWRSHIHAKDAEVELSPPFMMLKGDQERGIYCLWFYDEYEFSQFADYFETIGCKMIRDQSSRIEKSTPSPTSDNLLLNGSTLLGLIKGCDADREKRVQAFSQPPETEDLVTMDPFKILADKINTGKLTLLQRNSDVSSSSGPAQWSDLVKRPTPKVVSGIPPLMSLRVEGIPKNGKRNKKTPKTGLYGPSSTMQTVEQIEKSLLPLVSEKSSSSRTTPVVKGLDENKRLEEMLKQKLGLVQRTDSDAGTTSSSESNLSRSPSSTKLSSVTPFLTPLESTDPSRASSSARSIYTVDDIHGKTIDEVEPSALYETLANSQAGDLVLIPKTKPGRADTELTWVRSEACNQRRRSLAVLEAQGHSVIDNALFTAVKESEVLNGRRPGLMTQDELVKYIQEKLQSDASFVGRVYQAYCGSSAATSLAGGAGAAGATGNN